MYLENCIYENNPKNVKRLEIGKDIRGVIFRVDLKITNQKNNKTNTHSMFKRYDCRHIHSNNRL